LQFKLNGKNIVENLLIDESQKIQTILDLKRVSDVDVIYEGIGNDGEYVKCLQLTSDRYFGSDSILDLGLKARAVQILLINGVVRFRFYDGWTEPVGFSSPEYNALWTNIKALTFSGNRAMAHQLVPEELKNDWTLMVYFGPNIARVQNIVISPYPIESPINDDIEVSLK
jgi:hypothetical protein